MLILGKGPLKLYREFSLGASFQVVEILTSAFPACRDTVQLYKQLYDSGLQYGPAFRLLRNVHIPDFAEQEKAANSSSA